jgi:AraC-like DNA-binding protein
LSTEQLIDEHIISYLITGTNVVHDGVREYTRTAGCFTIFRKNCLAKVVNTPLAGGEYKSISLKLPESFLKEFSREYGYTGDGYVLCGSLHEVELNDTLKEIVESLAPYLGQDERKVQAILVSKTTQMLIQVLKEKPELKNIFFDFRQPGKKNLEGYMNTHFKKCLSMMEFAEDTSRSLTAFKKDFKQIFHEPPGRWLLKRRLNEAHYLITRSGKKVGEACLEVGLKNLSHFSFAFKKQFGINPSALEKTTTKRPRISGVATEKQRLIHE